MSRLLLYRLRPKQNFWSVDLLNKDELEVWFHASNDYFEFCFDVISCGKIHWLTEKTRNIILQNEYDNLDVIRAFDSCEFIDDVYGWYHVDP